MSEESKPTANAASGVVKTLTPDQLEKLNNVIKVADGPQEIVKNGTTTIKENGEEYEVDAYDVTLGDTIQTTETIDANSLSKAAENAVWAINALRDAQKNGSQGPMGLELRLLQELDWISAEMSEEAEKGTITKALKVLDDLQLKMTFEYVAGRGYEDVESEYEKAHGKSEFKLKAYKQ
jgi:hypothetical protein